MLDPGSVEWELVASSSSSVEPGKKESDDITVSFFSLFSLVCSLTEKNGGGKLMAAGVQNRAFSSLSPSHP